MTAARARSTRHVALLRAVNVGGRGVVRMTDVAAVFSGAGCVNVRTVIQSGNVLFDLPAGGLGPLQSRVRRDMCRLLDTEPVIVYRPMRHLEAIVEEGPFGALATDAGVKLYVAFLVAAPRTRPAFPLVFQQEQLEAIGMRGNDVLIVSRRKPNGMFGFPANWLERELGVAATARNWSTIRKLVELSRRRDQLPTPQLPNSH
jgi:uncharacterized protein (DUF1697 family)